MVFLKVALYTHIRKRGLSSKKKQEQIYGDNTIAHRVGQHQTELTNFEK